MGRSPCCEKNGLKKGPWTSEEDQKLIEYIQKHGYGNWRTLPNNAGMSLNLHFKSCFLFPFLIILFHLLFIRFAEMWQELPIKVD